MIEFLKGLFIKRCINPAPRPTRNGATKLKMKIDTNPRTNPPVERSVKVHDRHDYIVTIGGEEFIGSCTCWKILPDFYDASYEQGGECYRLLEKAKYEGVVK